MMNTKKGHTIMWLFLILWMGTRMKQIKLIYAEITHL